MPFKTHKFFLENEAKAFVYLIKNFDFSPAQVQRLIAKKRLRVNGEFMTQPSGIIQGECELTLFEGSTKGLQPLYDNDAFAIFDKPSGLLVHPHNFYTEYSLLDEAKYHFGKEANITHRIDQETSGLVIVAKTREDEIGIKQLFEDRLVEKTYRAIVTGELTGKQTVDAPLKKVFDRSNTLQSKNIVHPNGKASLSLITPLHYNQATNTTLVEVKPKTGRQHQIRVHLFHVKHPIVGDYLYNMEEVDAARWLDKEMSEEERVQKSGYYRLLLQAHELQFMYKGVHYAFTSKQELSYDVSRETFT
jgi:23S rRNA pseudouridine1911/1915/1917 synthase